MLDELIVKLHAQDIDRSLCILGGEPLCQENLFLTTLLVKTVAEKSPNTPIYIWSGYTLEELQDMCNPHMDYILKNIDYLIDGRYEEELRDVTLYLRGSSNQRIHKFDREKKL